MGLSMDDIHTPSVPSGPTTNGARANGVGQEKVSLIDLIEQKTQVEEELKALGGVLDSHGVNMNTSLTTFDGYPRDDIDVAQIRTTRARIIRLKNDYKGLMSQIETGLHERHAQARASIAPPPPSSSTTTSSSSTRPAIPSPNPSTTPVGATNATDSTLVETPFARVNTVAPNSPADEAGLMVGDRVRRFGDVNWMNHEKLGKVAEVVRRNQDRSVVVKVVRSVTDGGEETRELSLRLVPRANWGGRGLLGCHLLPL